MLERIRFRVSRASMAELSVSQRVLLAERGAPLPKRSCFLRSRAFIVFSFSIVVINKMHPQASFPPNERF